jgi:hypothetical protein
MKGIAAGFRGEWMNQEFAGVRVAWDDQPANALEIEF